MPAAAGGEQPTTLYDRCSEGRDTESDPSLHD
jgi:hypothetical protein